MTTETSPREQLFYVLSLKHSARSDRLLTWWGPDNSGYYFRLERSGKYTAKQIADESDYYNDGRVTVAVPCEQAEAFAIRVGDSTSTRIDMVRVDERVVEYRHIVRWRPRKKQPVEIFRR